MVLFGGAPGSTATGDQQQAAYVSSSCLVTDKVFLSCTACSIPCWLDCRPATSSCIRRPSSGHTTCQRQTCAPVCVQGQAAKGPPGQAARAQWLPGPRWIQHDFAGALIQCIASSRCSSQTKTPASLWGWCVCLRSSARTGSAQPSWPGCPDTSFLPCSARTSSDQTPWPA